MTPEHKHSSIFAKGVLITDPKPNTAPQKPENGKNFARLRDAEQTGMFSDLTEKEFPPSEVPSSTLFAYQLSALGNALDKLAYQRARFARADTPDDQYDYNTSINRRMSETVRAFDRICLGINVENEDYIPSVDVENWQPLSNSPIQQAVDEGRYNNINLREYPIFIKSRPQLALHRVRAMKNALDVYALGHNVTTKIKYPGLEDDEDDFVRQRREQALKGMSQEEADLRLEIIDFVYEAFHNHNYALLE